MFSNIKASFLQYSDEEKHLKAETLFLENHGEKVVNDDGAVLIIPDDASNFKDDCTTVLHHWILDSAKIGKLLPIKYYYLKTNRQINQILSGRRIYFDVDESDPDEFSFYLELSQEASKFGAFASKNTFDADLTITQFVSVGYDRYTGYASPLWLLRILYSGSYEQPYLPLDYPCPFDPIKCENPPIISLSGFSHADREPLIAMITLAGGIYTTELTEANTHLVSEGKETEKAKWAKIWDVPVRDQNWLERCFFQWEWLDK